MNVRRKNLLATLFLIALLLALPVAAAIQTLWLNDASRGEADRLRRGISNAARQIRADLSFEFASIATLLSPDLDSRSSGEPVDMDHLSQVFPDFLAAWSGQTRFPGLIEEIVYLGALSEEIPQSYDRATMVFGETVKPYPAWLGETLLATREGRVWPGANPLTIVVPMSRIVEQVAGAGGATTVRVIDPGFLLIRLDEAYLTSVVLPDLVDAYLGADREYRVAVVNYSREELVWSNFETSYPDLTAPGSLRPDDEVSLAPFPQIGIGIVDIIGREAPREIAEGIAERFQEPLMRQWLEFRHGGENEEASGEISERQLAPPRRLTALIWHSAGGVEAAARAGRNRNLLFSYLVLSVLAGAAIAYYMLFRRANRLREREHEFVATVTHELRTPVAAIHAVADNLAEGIVTRPEQVREYGQAMLDEGRRLRTMIDQVLLYAGLRGGTGVGRAVPLRVDDLVARACSRIPELNRDHLIIRMEPNLPSFKGDPVAVESIIRNLVSNAAKHNDDTTMISLIVRSDHDKPAGGGRSLFNFVIEVKDNGRGIPRRELPRVGEPFFRGARSQADQIPGSGLGLSLVKRIAETYGGSFKVTSVVDQGTNVVVRLPFEHGKENES